MKTSFAYLWYTVNWIIIDYILFYVRLFIDNGFYKLIRKPDIQIKNILIINSLFNNVTNILNFIKIKQIKTLAD